MDDAALLAKIEAQQEQLELLKKELDQRKEKQALDVESASQGSGSNGVDVPGSPVKKNNQEDSPDTSIRHGFRNEQPTRIKLGIDKQINAKDVQLRSASFAQRMADHKRELHTQQQHSKDLHANRHYQFGTGSNIGASVKKAVSTSNVTSLEHFSKQYITERYMDHSVLEEEFKDKKILSVSQFYTKVHPPDYTAPDYANYVVIGIVARKSAVKMSKSDKKFIMLTLTDLKLDLSFAIHSKAFDTYWKIREGTIVAVLNPSVYLTRDESLAHVNTQVAAKSIGISITSEYDCLLEIGRSRDLGKCAALNAKGTNCQNWIDKSQATYCEYHVELGMKRSGARRMEFNSTHTRMFDPVSQGVKEYVLQSAPSQSNSSMGIRRRQERSTTIMSDRKNVRVDRSSIPAAFFGDDEDRETLEKRLKRKAEIKEKEERVRARLSRRPEGILLRKYNRKGELVEDLDSPEAPNSTLTSHEPLFTPKRLRTLGFDPAKQKSLERASNKSMAKKDVRSVSLRKPSVSVESDDDDLEII